MSARTRRCRSAERAQEKAGKLVAELCLEPLASAAAVHTGHAIEPGAVIEEQSAASPAGPGTLQASPIAHTVAIVGRCGGA